MGVAMTLKDGWIKYDTDGLAARRAAKLVLELVDLAGLGREETLARVAVLRGVDPDNQSLKSHNFSNWLAWAEHRKNTTPMPVETAAEILDVIVGPLRKRTGIDLTERKRHAIETMLMRHSHPRHVARSLKRLTYDLESVFTNVIREVDSRADRLRPKLQGSTLSVKMRQAMGDFDRRLTARLEDDRRMIARLNGLDPERDFHKVEEIRVREEAEREAAIEAYEATQDND